MTPYHIREAAEHLGLGMEDVRECVHELGGTVWDEDDDQVNNSPTPAHACHADLLDVLFRPNTLRHIVGLVDVDVLERIVESPRA